MAIAGWSYRTWWSSRSWAWTWRPTWWRGARAAGVSPPTGRHGDDPTGWAATPRTTSTTCTPCATITAPCREDTTQVTEKKICKSTFVFKNEITEWVSFHNASFKPIWNYFFFSNFGVRQHEYWKTRTPGDVHNQGTVGGIAEFASKWGESCYLAEILFSGEIGTCFLEINPLGLLLCETTSQALPVWETNKVVWQSGAKQFLKIIVFKIVPCFSNSVSITLISNIQIHAEVHVVKLSTVLNTLPNGIFSMRKKEQQKTKQNTGKQHFIWPPVLILLDHHCVNITLQSRGSRKSLLQEMFFLCARIIYTIDIPVHLK